ncbi:MULTISPECIES: DUF6507 family protein [unclassified Nocardiopsis]|uniref:DUF6507 family protein n=1 Tax=unclassified Nocardiopsis TaxID=2649073 RepID=UPI001356C926|nr:MULTISPECIES: DUF6507 family protein [unclassified Nocardiopsis]
MTAWNIQPSEVGAVLTNTYSHIGEEGGSDGLFGDMQTIEDRVTALSDHVNSTPIRVALGEFAEHYFGVMGDMLSLTGNAVTQTSEATTAYVEGNEEMALEAQRNADVVPPPPPPPSSGGPNTLV